jgi:N-acetylneuraminic acid mutarotase
MEEAPFRGRAAMTATVFRDRIWVIGGWSGDRVHNDIWSSRDGVDWEKVTDRAPFHPRAGHAAIVFRDRLWIVGGLYFDGNNDIRDLKDIWVSRDGRNWTLVRARAPFPARGGHTLTIFNNRLWLIGGIACTGDIWVSRDGISWEEVTGSAPFGSRGAHSTLAHDGHLWVIGGMYVDDENRYHNLQDIWRSRDGKTWEQVTEDMESLAGGNRALVYRDRLWTVGGLQRNGNVLYSSDGRDWNVLDASSSFGERVAHGAVVFKDRLWVLGGFDGAGNRSDVWHSTEWEGLSKRLKTKESDTTEE